MRCAYGVESQIVARSLIIYMGKGGVRTPDEGMFDYIRGIFSQFGENGDMVRVTPATGFELLAIFVLRIFASWDQPNSMPVRSMQLCYCCSGCLPVVRDGCLYHTHEKGQGRIDV